jgi:hypothetical protein
MTRVRAITTVAILSGALCLATGASYLTVSPTELTISALVTLGVLGCCALVAAGAWLAWTRVEARRLPLAVVGVAAFLYAAASVLGFVGAQVAHEARLEPTGLPRTLHAGGFVMGSLLLILVLAEVFRTASRPHLRAPGRRSEPA